MTFSKTLIKKQAKRKTKPDLALAIFLARKQKAWLKIAKELSKPTRLQTSVNLLDIDRQTTTGDTVLVIGKVIGLGDVTKKVRIAALSFSESAKEKLKKTKSEVVSIAEEIKSNPKASGLKIIK